MAQLRPAGTRQKAASKQALAIAMSIELGLWMEEEREEAARRQAMVRLRGAAVQYAMLFAVGGCAVRFLAWSLRSNLHLWHLQEGLGGDACSELNRTQPRGHRPSVHSEPSDSFDPRRRALDRLPSLPVIMARRGDPISSLPYGRGVGGA